MLVSVEKDVVIEIKEFIEPFKTISISSNQFKNLI